MQIGSNIKSHLLWLFIPIFDLLHFVEKQWTFYLIRRNYIPADDLIRELFFFKEPSWFFFLNWRISLEKGENQRGDLNARPWITACVCWGCQEKNAENAPTLWVFRQREKLLFSQNGISETHLNWAIFREEARPLEGVRSFSHAHQLLLLLLVIQIDVSSLIRHVYHFKSESPIGSPPLVLVQPSSWFVSTWPRSISPQVPLLAPSIDPEGVVFSF